MTLKHTHGTFSSSFALFSFKKRVKQLPLLLRRLGQLRGVLLISALLVYSESEAIDNKRVRIEVIGSSDALLSKQLIQSTSIPPLRADKQFWQQSDLKRAIQEEIPRWKKLLSSHGYFDASVRVRLKSTTYNWIIELSIAPRTRYHLHGIELFLQEKSKKQPVALPFAIEEEVYATVDYLKESEEKLLNFYKATGYATAQFLSKEIELNTVDKSASVTWVLSRGPFYTFGATDLIGLEWVRKRYVLNKLLFVEGTPFNQELIDCSATTLENCNQFSAVAVLPDWSREENGSLPITVALSEGHFRSIAFGINMMTNAGLGGRFLWENRCLTGRGDLLALRAYHSKREKSGSLVYNLPDFLPKQTHLRCQIEFIDETIRAYSDRSWTIGAFLERRLNKRLFFSYGAKALHIETSKTNDNSSQWLAATPLITSWSNSDNALNPLNGRQHQVILTPFMAISDSPYCFTQILLKNGLYLPLARWMTLAFGLQAGSLIGGSTHAIPPPLRFFGGGPNGFRGYAYKTLSPLDAENQPIGGRSSLLFQVEPRFRLNQELSLVPFFEVGRVYTREGPEIWRSFSRSLGIGVNYETMIGPIRFDFAVPLNPRKGIDSPFQIYLSFGAAF